MTYHSAAKKKKARLKIDGTKNIQFKRFKDSYLREEAVSFKSRTVHGGQEGRGDVRASSEPPAFCSSLFSALRYVCF